MQTKPMPCPKCKLEIEIQYAILELPGFQGAVRWRSGICPACNVRFTTIEQPLPPKKPKKKNTPS